MKNLQKARRLSSALLIATLLSACGGSGSDSQTADPADPLASFKQQKLAWQACDPTILGKKVPYFDMLGERVQCTTMRAPLDYAQPWKGELTVALSRVTAEQPAERRGAILFNPGGPNGDGLEFAPYYGALWADANPESVQGRALKQISSQYDLVGFSPRGVGASTQLYCASNEFEKEVQNLSLDRSPQNLANALYNARLQAQTCQKNPLTPYINTDQTARDMDLIRELAGDAKLNFIGYSYGTWLGAWYASLFPERVGRMLFDSSMNVAGTFDDAALLSEMGRQRVMDDVLAPYAARHPELFNLGTTAADVRQVLLTLPPALKPSVYSFISGAANKSGSAAESLVFLAAANGLKQLLQAQPQGTEDALHAAIETHVFMTSPMNNEMARNMAHELTQDYFYPAQWVPKSIVLDPQAAVNTAVICNDMPSQPGEQFWIDIGNQNAARYPISGGRVTAQPCLYWGGPNVVRPALANASRADNILMLQSRYDAATPFEGALSTLNALPNASMIMVENEYSHGIFPYGDSCVDPMIGEYFATGKIPPRTTACAGKPLPGDVPAPAPTKTLKAAPAAQPMAPAPQKASSAPYNDMARAEEIMRRIHEKIGKSNQHR